MIATIFNAIAPVFLLILAGSAVAEIGWLSRDGVDGLMSFALKFATPCLLFLSVRNLVLTAAMAPGINAYLFANLYNRSEDVAANTVLLATIASGFTAAGWIWFLG